MEILAETYVSKLNEYQQKTGVKVQYEEGSTEGPSHNKTFTCTAVVNGTRHPEATGKNKKEAKQNAARNAFIAIKPTLNTPFCSNLTPNNLNKKITVRLNPISWLNEYSQKNRVEFKLREFTKTDPTSSTQFFTYVCKYVCGDKEYPEAYGKSKKEAKEAAAKYVYEELNPNTEGHDKNWSNTPGSEMSALSTNMDHQSLAEDSRSSTPDNNNYIACLNEYCQKRKCVIDYKLIDKTGAAHTPEFVYKVVIDGTEFSEGYGKSSKEAKQHAARKGWMELQQRSDGNTQSSEEDTSSQTKQIHIKSAESQMCTSVSSSSDSVVLRDSVSSPMAISPAMSPMDVKPKIRLAPNFNLSPSVSPKIKGDAFNMNTTNQTKPSSNHTVTQAVKSRFLGDFDSIRRVGKGGFGRVFKARRKLEDQYFAVKIVKNKVNAYREVSALSKLNHPNIVRYYTCWVEETAYRPESSESNSTSDSGSSLEFLYIQMELCEGDTLRVWIYQRNSSDEVTDTERRKDAAHIFHQILQAVQYLHKHVIHRDLKPANIMFGSEGGVKVGDFGLATAVDSDDEQQNRSSNTGTRSYMSPEQLTHSYDKKVDIFALGLIYFELLWKLGTDNEKSKIWGDIKIRKFPPQFPEKFDFEHKLIHKMLNEKSKDRPEAGELISELHNRPKVFKNN
ncbi:interferon-induced, double-stranded RNA-activated protein kinase [Triplophysa dalaica]|uniref:interferon-induced, double-stranded RNA-activated protein kinase n=1 Tax=Triplophysa dalaica TaxID=1582913 RepID=UPI0024DF515B|nr:interferon-induced, double-stranded RNA-activated protein kinase [Triplophysa dalaica]